MSKIGEWWERVKDLNKEHMVPMREGNAGPEDMAGRPIDIKAAVLLDRDLQETAKQVQLMEMKVKWMRLQIQVVKLKEEYFIVKREVDKLVGERDGESGDRARGMEEG